ncbi:MAG: hypothetical protein ACKO0Z_01805 [Betaproteobacteria bacterium]
MSIKSWFRSWLLDDVAKNHEEAQLVASTEPSMHTLNRAFTITEALNGSYITFQKRKYNPNGPDEYRHEVYLVQPGESLVDAISTVLVLTEK